MTTSWQNRRRIGTFAWVMAWAGLVLGQLHALARHLTEDGKSDLDLAMTRFWAEPAGRALRPLLDWADPDTVYLTYGKVWFPIALAFTMCAFVVHSLRQPAGFEKWAWRTALTGYVLITVATLLSYWTQWTGYNAMFDISLALDIPGLLLTLIGSTMLGIAWLRRGSGLRLPAWLLVISIPFGLVITEITSLGNVLIPTMLAFAVIGRRLAQDPSYAERVASPARAEQTV